jgi:hypothetical protein
MTGAIQAMANVGAPPYVPTLTNRNLAAGGFFGPTYTALLIFVPGPGPGIGDFIFRTNPPLVDQNFTPEWDSDRGPLPGSGVHFFFRLTVLSGSPPDSGSATGVYLQMVPAGVSWGLSRSALGTSSGVWKLEITYGNGGPVVASATYNVSVQTIPP